MIWNELLVGHVPEIDLRQLPSDLRTQAVEPGPGGVFPLDQVEDRQKAIFAMIRALGQNVKASKPVGSVFVPFYFVEGDLFTSALMRARKRPFLPAAEQVRKPA